MLTGFGIDGSLLASDTELDVAGGLTLELAVAAAEPGALLLLGIGLLGLFANMRNRSPGLRRVGLRRGAPRDQRSR